MNDVSAARKINFVARLGDIHLYAQDAAQISVDRKINFQAWYRDENL